MFSQYCSPETSGEQWLQFKIFRKGKSLTHIKWPRIGGIGGIGGIVQREEGQAATRKVAAL
jgi:hypothetical protein